MSNTINKFTDSAGQPFFIGIDIHKKSWTITVRTLEMEVSHFTQKPDPNRPVTYTTAMRVENFSALMKQDFAAHQFTMLGAELELKT